MEVLHRNNVANFINLTNGIETLVGLPNGDFHFIRIQSTACEQKRWDFILQDLDHHLLMCLALGRDCIIYDYGHGGIPRALWQGCEWIRYALTRRWFARVIVPVVHGHDVGEYFDTQYRQLSERTLKKLDYYRKFLLTDEINLEVAGDKTSHDGQYDFYKSLLAQMK